MSQYETLSLNIEIHQRVDEDKIEEDILTANLFARKKDEKLEEKRNKIDARRLRRGAPPVVDVDEELKSDALRAPSSAPVPAPAPVPVVETVQPRRATRAPPSESKVRSHSEPPRPSRMPDPNPVDDEAEEAEEAEEELEEAEEEVKTEEAPDVAVLGPEDLVNYDENGNVVERELSVVIESQSSASKSASIVVESDSSASKELTTPELARMTIHVDSAKNSPRYRRRLDQELKANEEEEKKDTRVATKAERSRRERERIQAEHDAVYGRPPTAQEERQQELLLRELEQERQLDLEREQKREQEREQERERQLRAELAEVEREQERELEQARLKKGKKK